MLRCLSNDEASAGPGSAIVEGCEVIVFHSRDDMKAVTVQGSSKYDCKFGCFKMSVRTFYLIGLSTDADHLP